MDKGYEIYKGFFTDSEIESWENTIRSVYYFQALKMGFNSWDIDELVRFFEENSYDAGYHSALQCQQTMGGKWFASLPKIRELGIRILGLDFLTILGPVPIVNIPESKRLIYRWHSEYHYHPKRLNFFNIWFPIFREKRKDSGTMVLAEGTHKQHWDFVEYSGYNYAELGKKHTYTQYESVIKEPLKEVVIELDRKDMVVFHGNLLHKSTVNTSNNITYATSIRVFDTSKDPTLSSDMMVKPYKGLDVGYPELRL